MSAKYLIRFDDITPRMNWAVWNKIELLLERHNIKPLLAVVPDNKDSTLDVDIPNTEFWSKIRQYQKLGWAIGLHGYQHTYITKNRGLVGIAKTSEFAGLTEAVQREKLKEAIAIFEARKINPDLWIAPGHTFDSTTIKVLCSLGINKLSDGFFLYPKVDSQGMIWVPQQMWKFRPMPFGLFTVCYHINSWKEHEINQFNRDIVRFRSSITDLDSAIATFSPTEFSRTLLYSRPLISRALDYRAKLKRAINSFVSVPKALSQ